MNIYLILASLLLLIITLAYLRSRKAKKKVVRVIDNNCTGCQRCIKKCRYNTLEMVNDKRGRHLIVKYPDKCTACGDCVAICKFDALGLVNRKQPE